MIGCFLRRCSFGRLPWSYDQIWRVYQKAAKAADLGRLGTHSLRHTFRTTMNVYGDVVIQDMAVAHRKVVGLALNGWGKRREKFVSY